MGSDQFDAAWAGDRQVAVGLAVEGDPIARIDHDEDASLTSSEAVQSVVPQVIRNRSVDARPWMEPNDEKGRRVRCDEGSRRPIAGQFVVERPDEHDLGAEREEAGISPASVMAS